MDLHRQARDGRHLPAEPGHGFTRQIRHHFSSNNVRSARHTSPLPQRHWEDIPLPYRPRDWRDPSEGFAVPAAVPEPLFNRTQRSSGDHTRPQERLSGDDSRPQDALPRQRRRPHALGRILGRREFEDNAGQIDPSLLYPQISPYDDAQSTYSAPDQLEHPPRSVSQPNTPAFHARLDHPGDSIEPPLMLIPRSPTYPPASRRRVRSTTNVADATFTDEEEFHLFVQATAGLGPEQAFRQSEMSSPDRYERRSLPAQPTSPRADLVSPIEQTPTTMMALQHLAQMPAASDPQPPLSSRPGPRRIMTAQPPSVVPAPDFWVHPPSATFEERIVSPIEDEILGVGAPGPAEEEELPDYAASQAQAQAAQRVDAVRRAQELQRRWAESNP